MEVNEHPGAKRQSKPGRDLVNVTDRSTSSSPPRALAMRNQRYHPIGLDGLGPRVALVLGSRPGQHKVGVRSSAVTSVRVPGS